MKEKTSGKIGLTDEQKKRLTTGLWELPDDDPFAQVEMHVAHGDDMHGSIREEFDKYMKKWREGKRPK
jgi:hypothetical protein